jgi:small subunit ribosomal protein S6
MRNYEVTFIVDPVLSSGEIEGVAKNYEEHLTGKDCELVHTDAMGLRQLAYPVNKRTSGVYYCIEFKSPGNEVIEGLELALRRDERIIRFLTVKLDKYGVKYNDDKRQGLIGKKRKEEDDSGDSDQGKKKQNEGKPKIFARKTSDIVTDAVGDNEEE